MKLCHLVNVSTSNYGSTVIHYHELGVDVDHEPLDQAGACVGALLPHLAEFLSTSALLPCSGVSRVSGMEVGESRDTGVRKRRWS